MKVMAALILQKGGNRETSRFLWTEIYHSSEDPSIRRNAFMHLQGLQALDDIELLEGRARLFREQTGRWPQTFQEMVGRGILPGIPLDPNGVAHQLHPEGKVTLHPNSHILLDSGPSPP